MPLATADRDFGMGISIGFRRVLDPRGLASIPLVLLSQKTSESKSRGRPPRGISYGLGFVHQRGLGWISNREVAVKRDLTRMSRGL